MYVLYMYKYINIIEHGIFTKHRIHSGYND